MLTTHAHTRAPSDDRSQPAPSAAEGSTRSAHTDCGESNTQDNLLEHLQARSTCEQSRAQSQSRLQSTPKPRHKVNAFLSRDFSSFLSWASSATTRLLHRNF